MLFNKARAIEYMSSCGIDALVASSPVNITYLSDYFCWQDAPFREYMIKPGASPNRFQAYAVFLREGEPALVVNQEVAVNAAGLWIRDLRLFGDSFLDDSLPPGELSHSERHFFDLLHAPDCPATATDALLQILKERGLAGARIGLEMEGLPEETRDVILGALPQASLQDCSNLIRLIRMVKTPDEMQRLTRAAEINEMAAMESLALARPGGTLADMAQHYRKRAAELGADFEHFALGIKGMGIATEPHRVLTEQDLCFVDFGCIYRRCYSDSGTTLAMQEPSAAMIEKHAALRDCLGAGAGIIRPGVKSSAVEAAMRHTLSERGVSNALYSGHSLGLEIRDYPIIVPDSGLRIRDNCIDVPSDLPLEADMVINLEASVHMPGVASLHAEQSFAVTDQGSHTLVQQDRMRPVQPGH